jgi:hypothetical protein
MYFVVFRAESYAVYQFTWLTIHFLVIFTLPTPLKNSLLNLLLFPIYFPLNTGSKSAVNIISVEIRNCPFCSKTSAFFLVQTPVLR